MSIYGYIRVSTKEQNEDRQLLAMQGLNISEQNLFIDKQSGKDFVRPAYQTMVQRMKKDEISLPKWIQSHKSETALKPLEIRHFTAFAPSSAAPGEGRFSVLCG